VKNHKRFQINLRVLLLFMALCCTVAAHVRINLDMQQKQMRSQLKLLEIYRSVAASSARLAEIDAQIKALKQGLGEAD
jgi:hypothetical protein